MVSLALPAVASAQSLVRTIVPCSGVDCSICDIASLAQNVLNAGIFLAVVFSAITFIRAGFMLVTAEGNASKAGDAKRLFKNVVIGIIVLLSAWLIVDVLMRTLTGNAYWSRICGYAASAALPVQG